MNIYLWIGGGLIVAGLGYWALVKIAQHMSK